MVLPPCCSGEGGAIALSPDGKSVVAQTQDSPSQFHLLTTGAGEARELTKDNVNHNWAHWFPDGKRILFTANEPNKGVKFYVLDTTTGKSQPISPEGVNGTAFVISPGLAVGGGYLGQIKKAICIRLRVVSLDHNSRAQSRRTADHVQHRQHCSLYLSAGRVAGAGLSSRH